jgi:class 3 adenylate cyclase
VPLRDELDTEVARIFRSQWETRNGNVVPEPEQLSLQNNAVILTGTVLYADLASSTSLVNSRPREPAAEIYKTFLHCAAKIIRSENGTITAYDGDRVMAVFIGSGMEAEAVRAALKLKFAVTSIVMPAFQSQYPKDDFAVQHCCGIDKSDLFVARTGIRGSNDLVWVGRAANHAAKLSEVREWPFSIYITDVVHSQLSANLRVVDGSSMWESRNWAAAFGSTGLFRTKFHIPF